MKFDLLFELQVPRPWDEGKESARYFETIEQSVFADRMGFTTSWFVEHHFLSEFAHLSAPDAVMGAIAQQTEKMRLGFGVTLMPGAINHPIRVAERAATLDIISEGRIDVGTGRSTSVHQILPFGVDPAETRSQWEEATKLLPRLWTEEDVSYQGHYWSWDSNITVLPRPVQQPHPPIWVAATQPATCALAGEKGIGLLLPAITDPQNLSAEIAAYHDAVREPADQIGQVRTADCALFCLALCLEDEDRARTVAGPAAIWYQDVQRRIYADEWKGQPLDTVPDSYRYQAEMRKAGKIAGGNWTGGNIKSGEDLIDSGALCVGDPARVIERIAHYRSLGCDRIVFLMQFADIPHADVMRSIELFGTEVMPHFADSDVAAPAATTD